MLKDLEALLNDGSITPYSAAARLLKKYFEKDGRPG
jgi:hypothetical protein